VNEETMMSTPVFKRLSLEQFSQLLARFPFTRRVNAVHMHHTWRPQRSDFRGHETIVAMWRFHTQQQGWRDIAQHLTIDPEGWVWLGRNWNLPPVSASGHNGNAQFGPFMFEMIGNFDRGCDPFDGAQREAALEVVAQVQARFGLPADSLVFHNAMSTKTCPGSSLDFAQILAEVEQRSTARGRSPKRAQEARGPFPDESDLVVREAIEALSRAPLGPPEPGDAEPSHDEGAAPQAAPSGAERAERAERAPARSSRGAPIDAALLAALRPHLVNLRLGRLSERGELSTTPADVDAIFEQSLPRALQAAKAQGRRLRLLFYAHGGLVSESSGLQIAARHVDWWKRNDVYPIHFVWETGLFETIGQLLTRAQQGTMRGLPRDFWDHTLDPLIEVGARALQGARIWAGMKASAEHAVDAPNAADPMGGGARYVAVKLKAFCDAHPGDVELHAAGHSAGSIFHSHFLACAHELGVPTFESAQFLAPAVRIDTFRDRLAARIGDDGAVRRVTLFTMQRDYERADDCAGVYHKSLLYLVSNALEQVAAVSGLQRARARARRADPRPGGEPARRSADEAAVRARRSAFPACRRGLVGERRGQRRFGEHRAHARRLRRRRADDEQRRPPRARPRGCRCDRRLRDRARHRPCAAPVDRGDRLAGQRVVRMAVDRDVDLVAARRSGAGGCAGSAADPHDHAERRDPDADLAGHRSDRQPQGAAHGAVHRRRPLSRSAPPARRLRGRCADVVRRAVGPGLRDDDAHRRRRDARGDRPRARTPGGKQPFRRRPRLPVFGARNAPARSRRRRGGPRGRGDLPGGFRHRRAVHR